MLQEDNNTRTVTESAVRSPEKMVVIGDQLARP
jgi:hypothetical protein